jgi:hypothetical protein
MSESQLINLQRGWQTYKFSSKSCGLCYFRPRCRPMDLDSLLTSLQAQDWNDYRTDHAKPIEFLTHLRLESVEYVCGSLISKPSIDQYKIILCQSHMVISQKYYPERFGYLTSNQCNCLPLYLQPKDSPRIFDVWTSLNHHVSSCFIEKDQHLLILQPAFLVLWSPIRIGSPWFTLKCWWGHRRHQHGLEPLGDQSPGPLLFEATGLHIWNLRDI